MKDVAALCRRVVIIAQGQIIYDGSLAGIIDRFSGHKVISLQLLNGDDARRIWTATAKCLSSEPPRIKLRVARSVVPDVLGHDPGQPHGRRRQRRRSAAGGSDRRDVLTSTKPSRTS